jgi:hypothetical protein
MIDHAAAGFCSGYHYAQRLEDYYRKLPGDEMAALIVIYDDYYQDGNPNAGGMAKYLRELEQRRAA